MLKTLTARFKQGYRTGKFPDAAPTLPPTFRGRPVIDPTATEADAAAMCAVCPAAAVLTLDGRPAIDMGRCIFCGKCAAASAKVRFSQEYRLAAFAREDLIVKAGEPTVAVTPPSPEIAAHCGRSLKIREVSAGGCAACELDYNVLGTLAWDMGRFGIQTVASPRHADAVLVTGPVTRNMALALQKTHDAMPEPCYVIACGACAISGGLYAESSETLGGVNARFQPDMYVPGCPPHPMTLLHGLLRLIGQK